MWKWIAIDRDFLQVMLLSTGTTNRLRCFLCNAPLSQGPVTQNDGGNSICGRCPPGSNRCFIYEELAKEAALFPCRYSDCKEAIRFNAALDHENACPYKTITCPWCESWQGAPYSLLKHAKKVHPDFVVDSAHFYPKDIKNSTLLLQDPRGLFLLDLKEEYAVRSLHQEDGQTKSSELEVVLTDTGQTFQVNLRQRLIVYRCLECNWAGSKGIAEHVAEVHHIEVHKHQVLSHTQMEIGWKSWVMVYQDEPFWVRLRLANDTATWFCNYLGPTDRADRYWFEVNVRKIHAEPKDRLLLSSSCAPPARITAQMSHLTKYLIAGRLHFYLKLLTN